MQKLIQGFISHWNGISVSDEGKFTSHLVKDFNRVKVPYITMIFFTNYITTVIISTFLNNIFMDNKQKCFLRSLLKSDTKFMKSRVSVE